MGKMSFTELQEEIYTEELKKIEKESNLSLIHISEPTRRS